MNKLIIIITLLWSATSFAQQVNAKSSGNHTADKSIGDLTSSLEKMKLQEGKNKVFSAIDHSYTVYAIVDKALNISTIEVQNAQHISIPVHFKNIAESAAKKQSKPKTVRVCKEFCFPDGAGITICGLYCTTVKKGT